MIPRGRECSRLSRSCVLILLCWLALHTLTSSLSQRLQFSYLNEDLEFVDLTDSGSEAITAAPIAGQQQQQKDPTFLVILIITRPKSIFRRKAIRESFLRHANETGHGKSVKHYFVIGSEGLERDLQLRLQEEPDLLMLPIQDGYERLTVKVLSAMSVLHVIEDFKYVLKVDDDMFVRVPELVKDLEDNHPRKMHYQGYFRGAVKVLRDQPENKWFEPDYPICDRFASMSFLASVNFR